MFFKRFFLLFQGFLVRFQEVSRRFLEGFYDGS